MQETAGQQISCVQNKQWEPDNWTAGSSKKHQISQQRLK